ncbi:hypothetical protein ES708_29015 [subsurface metagenome]
MAGLSGDLADKQDADKLQGRNIDDAAPGDGEVLYWDDGTSKWKSKAIPVADISCCVHRSADKAIADATTVLIDFDVEDWDTDGCHDNVTNNDRLTCKTAGKYLLTANIQFAANSTGTRGLYFYKYTDSEVWIASFTTPTPAAPIPARCILLRLIDLAVDDYVFMKVYQDSGGSLNLTRNADYSVYFSMVKMPG